MEGFLEVYQKKTFYKTENENGASTVLFLHGWGGNADSFDSVFFRIGKKFRVVSLDLWGFGKSDLPDGWDVLTYAQYLREFLRLKGLRDISVVAHSFGGRVAAVLNDLQPGLIRRMILTDCAGIRPKRSLKKTLAVWRYKILKKLKKIFPKTDLSRFGSEDYRALPLQMRSTFVKVVNEDLSEYFRRIRCPTLLIWGEKDKETPMYMAKKIKRGIPDCALIVFRGCGHFAYLQEAEKFARITDRFLGD